MKQRTSGPLLERGDRPQDVLLGLRLDLRQLLKPVVARGLFELFDRRDLQVVVDDPCGRRSHPGDAKEREEPRRDSRLQLGVSLRGAGRDELLDRFSDRGSDPGNLPEALFRDELGQGLAKVADGAGGGAIGDGTKDVLALELDEVADLVEDIRDRIVAYG